MPESIFKTNCFPLIENKKFKNLIINIQVLIY
jgi:hypothetical protein